MNRFDTAPLQGESDVVHRRQIAQVLNRTTQGKLNCVDEFTLTQSQASEIDPDNPLIDLVIGNPLCSSESFIGFMALNQGAAEELANGTMWVAAQTNGQFTVRFRASTIANRSFRYIIVG